MPPLAAAARFNQSPLKKARSPKSEPTFQPLIFFCPVARYWSTLMSPPFMPSPTSALCSSERSLKSKILPVPMPIRPRRGELQGEVEILEEVRLHHLLVDLGEIDGRGRRWRGLLEEGRQWLHLVARLDLDYVRHIGRIEELRAIGRGRELRGGTKHLLDARGCFAFPIGPSHQIVAGARS